MVLSMTGYGRAEEILNGRDITVELRSVNSRYFEYSSRVPRAYSFLEDGIKKVVAAKVSRGKVELSLTVQSIDVADTAVQVNWALVEEYNKALSQIAAKMEVHNDVSSGMLARFPEVLSQTAATLDEDQMRSDVQTVVQQAVDAFVAMRAKEGQRLKEDVLARLTTVEGFVGEIERDSAVRVKAYQERLYQRLQELMADHTVDEARVLTEAAVFADKTAVDEETVRLHSHVAQYRDILEMQEPVGRKLDFLTQELNREANTIGSKCQDLAITRLVVDLKAEIEKIREQIQNIE